MKYAATVLVLFLSVSGCATIDGAMMGGDSINQRQTVSTKAAVQNLYDQASDAFARAELGPAEAALERALRMEPSNGHLWFALAKVAKAKDELAKARDLAQRARTYAASDASLQRAIDHFLRGVH